MTNATARIVRTFLAVLGIIMLGSPVASAQEAADIAISPATWAVGIVLVVLVIVGLVLARVKAQKDKAEVRELMRSIQDE